jgi:hypothetical protein
MAAVRLVAFCSFNPEALMSTNSKNGFFDAAPNGERFVRMDRDSGKVFNPPPGVRLVELTDLDDAPVAIPEKYFRGLEPFYK